MLLVVGLGLLEFLFIEGSTAHVVENGADPVDGGKIGGIGRENLFVLVDRLISHAHVLVGGSAGDVLRRVGGSQIEARIQEARVEILRLLEILNGLVELAGLIRLDAFIEKVAGFQLAAARHGDKTQ